MTKERLIQILENPLRIKAGEEREILRILDEYPYFQSLRTHLLIYYKHHDPVRYQNELSITAAHTADRGHLRQYLEREWPDPEAEILLPQEPETEAKAEPGTEQTAEQVIEKTASPHISTPPAAGKDEKTESAAASPPEASAKLSYIEWVKRLSGQSVTPPPAAPDDPKQRKRQLIDRFLSRQPKIRPRKDAVVSTPAEALESVREDQWLMTETLAQLYVKQKKYDKALKAYEILMLKYPKKNRYFAARMAEIKNLLNE
ncbi:MAG: hypothetical protein GXO24_05520 [Chlorobi bacterium]|nr:hypothetical protein [Chlorobiota bacterium]